MKTILVDAWNTFVTKEGINKELQALLDTYENPKLILTNANEEQMVKLGLVDLPYDMFTLAHDPDKDNPVYYRRMLDKYGLTVGDVVYFEHNTDAVKSAQSVGITTHHYDKEKKDLVALKVFLDGSL